MAMTKKERLQMERLQRLLAAEREKSEKQWDNYRKMGKRRSQNETRTN
jgi:hypothetical protein